MKILHIDETFHPLFGYHCNPLAKFQAANGDEVYIIAPEAKYIYPVYHSFGEYGDNQLAEDVEYMDSTGVNIIRVRGRGYISSRLIYDYPALFKAIDSIKPDVMMVHCVETLTAMRVMFKYRDVYPMVFDSHMLAMATQNKLHSMYEFIYKSFITKEIVKQKYTIIITQNDDYINKRLGIPKTQTVFGSFGTDTDLFSVNTDKKKMFLKEKGLPEDTFLIVSTGKLSEGKDGKLFANAVKNKFNTNREVAIVIVADFSGEYEKEVKKILDSSQNSIFYYGVQRYTDLPWFYQIADVVVFPKQCSMSFYDAQSCGSPVISEEVNVNLDRNSHGNGFCFKPGDCEDLRSVIEKTIELNPDDYMKMRQCSRSFVEENYSYSRIANQYRDIMLKEISRFNERHK